MDQTMSLQFVLDTEATAAHITGVRLFAGMFGNMNHQRRSRAKGLPAIAALEREHVRVCTIVHEQGGLLLECFTAYVANIWPLAGMNASVILDIAPRREHTAAQIAWYFLDAGVGLFQMSGQTLIYAEPFAA